MVRMGLRAASPTTAADDDDDGGGGGDDGPEAVERICRDREHTYRSAARRRHVGCQHAAQSSRRFDSMQEIAGNLAAGVQRIGFHCALPWTRSRRRRAAAERSAAASHHVVDGSAVTEEEQRARACEQILQLSEQQIVGMSATYCSLHQRVPYTIYIHSVEAMPRQNINSIGRRSYFSYRRLPKYINCNNIE